MSMKKIDVENIDKVMFLLMGIITQAYKDLKHKTCPKYEKKSALKFLKSKRCNEYADYICAYYGLANTTFDEEIKSICEKMESMLKG